MSSTLAAKTLYLVLNRPKSLSLRRIADETGLSYAWISNLTYGRVDPNAASVGNVETLYTYLSGEPVFK